MSGRRWRIEAPLVAAMFLDLLGFGMILADFQLRAEGTMPEGWPTGFTIGCLLASTFLIQILTSPRWGSLSDRIGRKPVLLACSLLSACAMLIYGVADSIWMLLLSRIVAGLGGANVAVAQALVADQMSEEERAVSIGRIGAAVSAGLIIGPVVGGFLGTSSMPHLVGWVGGIASLVGAALIFLLLPAPAPRDRGPLETAPVFHFKLLAEVPGLARLALIASVAWFSLAMLEGTFARLINQLYGYDQREFGVLFGFEAFVGVIVQGVLLAAMRKWLPELTLLRAGFVLQGVGLLLNPFAGWVPAITPIAVLIIASALFAIGGAVANPTLNAACSALTPKHKQGELFGVLQATRSIGFLAGPLLGGILFDWQPAIPYVVAFAVCMSAAVLVPRRLPSAKTFEPA